jgi:ABC-type Fe3+-hydroxamate transport system substrate-binding protein
MRAWWAARRALALGFVLMAGGVWACGGEAASNTAQDSLGRATKAPASTAVDSLDDFGAPVMPLEADARVVSLNPTATEVLFALGVQRQLVGRSDYDEFPAEAKRLPALGNGIKPNVEAVLAARPALVVLYATADNRPAADAFARAGVRVLALRGDRIEGFHRLVRILGTTLGASEAARVLSDSVAATLDTVRARVARNVPAASRPAVLWPVWPTPPMVIGQGSYLHELLEIAGARNVFADLDAPSPQVNIEEVVRRAPDRVVSSLTRADELRSSPVWRSVPAVARGDFVIIDPALTLRPSVQLGMAASALARALHPTLADSLP